jgi:nicotinamidase-related amidase
MKRHLHLLVIDPQNDFCDLPAPWGPADPLTGAALAPALPVPGAHADLLRVAGLIARAGAGLAGISLTLDAHHRYDIAHPPFWQQADGGAVAPFTEITAAQVRAGQFRPRAPDALERTLSYLDRLEAAGRYHLMVWPVHCRLGAWGQNVHAAVQAACDAWEERHQRVVNTVIKGTSPWTEHYSALQAEVTDAADAATQLNRGLLETLRAADTVYICGEAGSHCVRATTEHLAGHWDSAAMDKLVLLTDCMSPVTGFDDQYQQFLSAMHARGVRLATSATALAELHANESAA